MMLSIPVYSVSTQITKPYVETDMVEKGHGLIWCTTLTVTSKNPNQGMWSPDQSLNPEPPKEER